MNPSEPTPGAEAASTSDNWKTDEGALLAMLEEIERRHGYIPQQIGDEVSRLLEVKLERLKRAQAKLESGVRRDVQQHVARWRGEEGNLIMILHEIQNQYGYVPREVAMELSRELGVKLARIYEVITFYHYFKLQPPGRHNVTICNGTACYLKGAAGLLAELRAQLGVGEGQTTPDREFHVDVVRCIGCCGMSPAVVCDGRTHGRVKPTEIAGILDEARHPAKKEVPV
ncbi:MAG TPA: NAD(P)H-dependent oxidoreductase subunit E [Opitutaceae bacterium]|nr:NAD(P)H-dependent oxidoreductase subunit E [Opitutaceae bacterium]